MGSKIQDSARSPLLMLSSSTPSSPSFNSYSSSSRKLAEIAARVVQELENVSEDAEAPADQDHQNDFFVFHQKEEEEEEEDDEEFEFSFVGREPDVTADEIFHNGQIRPLYHPLFNTNLLLESSQPPPPPPPVARKRLPLGKLFLREETDRETSSSCSSSEADELEGVPTGSYCVWNPNERKTASSSRGMRKKSNSTGTVSRRWKLKDLLLHTSSHGEGKDEDNHKHNKNGTNRDNSDNAVMVLFTTTTRNHQGNKKTGGEHGRTVIQSVGVNELGRAGDKRRSYLPYRQDLVGFFSNVNGLSRNLPPL